MNILLINHYAGSPEHGMEYRPYYMAKEWSKAGHQVTIVAANQSHLRTNNPETDANICLEVLDGINYLWLKTPPYKGNSLSRVINMFAFVGKLLFYSAYISKKYAPDVVIASSTYPLDIYPAYRIAKRCNAKLIFEVHDLWPLSPMQLGKMSPWHPFIFTMQIAENFAYRSADIVVSMLPRAIGHMVKHGMETNKFVYIPNGINVPEWEGMTDDLPETHKSVFDRIKARGHFIVGYAGSHGVANALHVLLDAALHLRDKPISFVLVGQGPEKDKLIQHAKEKNLDSIYFLPPISKGQIPGFLSLTDALYIGWNKNPLYRFGISPNKLLDYMMSAKPVIHSIDAANDPVAECCCGVSVPAESPQEIARAIAQLSTASRNELATMGQNGKCHVLAKHDYKALAKRFLDVISSK